MPPTYPENGWALRKALSFASDIGCRVWQPRRTGDVCVFHQSQACSVRHNNRRKDASRQLITYLRSTMRSIEGSALKSPS